MTQSGTVHSSKVDFFVHFLGELKIQKRHFEINWPLTQFMIMIRGTSKICKKFIFHYTMEESFTKHLSFSLLAKNFKKQSFEARSSNHSGIFWSWSCAPCPEGGWSKGLKNHDPQIIQGFFDSDPVLLAKKKE